MDMYALVHITSGNGDNYLFEGERVKKEKNEINIIPLIFFKDGHISFSMKIFYASLERGGCSLQFNWKANTYIL